MTSAQGTCVGLLTTSSGTSVVISVWQVSTADVFFPLSFASCLSASMAAGLFADPNPPARDAVRVAALILRDGGVDCLPLFIARGVEAQDALSRNAYATCCPESSCSPFDFLFK